MGGITSIDTVGSKLILGFKKDFIDTLRFDTLIINVVMTTLTVNKQFAGSLTHNTKYLD